MTDFDAKPRQDFLRLTRFGSIYHVFGCLAIVAVDSPAREKASQAAIFVALISGVTLGRIWLNFKLSSYQDSKPTGEKIYDLLLLLSGLLWGAFSIWAYWLDEGFSGLSAITILASAGIAAGAAFTMLIKFKVMLRSLFMVLGPSILVLPLLSRDPFALVAVFFALLFLIFLYVNGHRQNLVYWLAHNSNLALQKQALELTAARNDALELSRAKSEFLAHMSHEIRTPLNGVIGMADLLAMSPIDGQQQFYVQNIVESGKLLLGLINDVLDFSRINSRALELHSSAFALQPAMAILLNMVEPMAQLKNLSLTLDCSDEIPPMILGDKSRLQQVVTNLLGNAIKFTDSGSIILQLSMRVSAKDGAALLRCEVRDTGMGISAENQKKIFDQFTQLENFSSNERGTGLGLTISQKLIELMGGQIGVTSEPGVGSTFWFEVPAVTAVPA